MNRSYMFAFAAIAMWSTLPTVSKLLLGEMDAYKVLCISSFFATLAMFIINICSKKWSLIKSYKLKDYIKMGLIGLPGVFLYYVLFYIGTDKMLASQAFIVNYMWPIMSIIFACIILKEKMTIRKIIAIILSFLGVFTVAGNDIINFNANTIIGVAACFFAAVCYGLYTAVNKKSNYDKQVSMTVAMLVAFLPSLVIVLARGDSFLIKLTQLPGLAYNGIIAMALANLSWALALQKGNTAKISNLAYITPFLSLVWTFFILKEPIKPLSIIGLCIIVLGIFIQLKGEERADNNLLKR